MKKSVPFILLLGCVAVIAAGLVRLFELRFEVGYVYPPGLYMPVAMVRG